MGHPARVHRRLVAKYWLGFYKIVFKLLLMTHHCLSNDWYWVYFY
jgi:hypothetical protein